MSSEQSSANVRLRERFLTKGRLWVVQEVALARDIRFMHGAGFISWDDVKAILDRRDDYGAAFPFVTMSSKSILDQSNLQTFGMVRLGATTGTCQIKRLDHLILCLAGEL